MGASLRKLCLTIGPQIVRDDTTNGVDVNRSCWYSSVAWWCAVCYCNNSQLKSCIPFIRYVLSEGQQMNQFFVTGVLSLFKIKSEAKIVLNINIDIEQLPSLYHRWTDRIPFDYAFENYLKTA